MAGPLRIFLLAVGLLLLVAAAACSGPKVSGFGLFQHNVAVGDTVRVELPFDPETGAGWRLVSFDSVMLASRGRETVAGDNPRFVFFFEARTPGKTEITFERVRPDGTTRRKTETLRIHQGATTRVESGLRAPTSRQ